MAQQEDGWPLGLQPLNVRVGLVRNRDMNGSVSFNTLLTGSPTSSTDSSSDLDTESTGSFFHDRSITLGTLLGVSNILELSRPSSRGRRRRTIAESSKDNKKTYPSKPKTWLFSLCSKLNTDAVTINNNNNDTMAPSLGHFLETERKAAIIYKRNQSPNLYGPDDFSNTLFVSDHVAPLPQCSAGLEHGDGYGAPLLISCLCGHLTH